MKRHIDFINFCIATNRGCNLRCTHCYVEPELLKSKFGMDEETFKKTYARVADLYKASKNVTHLNVEILGGEITRMPFEFWEKMLPYSIAQHEAFAKDTSKRNALAWCTNMIIQDERYFGLINSIENHEDWSLFIPWEPDTNRFGTRDKLFGRYLENVKRVTAPKGLNIIPTIALIKLPIQGLVDFIKECKFDDISCDMLYPYGSGKAFFEANQPPFHEVSDFYIRMTEAFSQIENLSLSPLYEVTGSLLKGTAFNLNGNDVLDVTVEPDGTVVMNSCMTGTEAPLPSKTLHVDDANWALKLLFENGRQMHVKYDLEHETCDQCEYLRYCNGGYYHYKYLSDDQLAKYATEDCPGYKKVWDYCNDKVKDTKTPVTTLIHERERQKIRKSRESIAFSPVNWVFESEITFGYESYFESLAEADMTQLAIVVDQDKVFGLTLVERLWFYETIGAHYKIGETLLQTMKIKDRHILARNACHDNYAFLINMADCVWPFVTDYPDHLLSRRIIEAISATLSEPLLASISAEPTITPSGLFIDDRNDELFRFMLLNEAPAEIKDRANSIKVHLSETSEVYMRQLKHYISMENLLSQRISR